MARFYLTSLLLPVFLLSQSVNALSSWYTPPGGPPTGSTAGDKVRGVNLGGWFILENWMMPDFFGQSPLDQHTVNDEWTFCSILGKTECLSRLQSHWNTYVTEDDFKRFSDYGLNTVRIPMGYWSWTDPESFEPYLQGQLPYLDKALKWANDYGLDVMMDLHGLPGGQNGQDNQGYKGPIEFQNNGTNMDRAMVALANMTSYVTADRFGGVVKAIELTNEPYITEYSSSGMDFYTLADFYVKGYRAVRGAEYIQSGSHEVMVVIHDAFQPLLNWKYFWSEASLGLNWTNYALDTHIYDAFNGAASKTNQEHLDAICYQSSLIAAAQLEFPIIVGEFSLGTRTYCVDYKSCIGGSLNNTISDSTSYADSLFLRQFWEVQADVYELGSGWIFWSHANQYAATWSWTQSAAQNWIPTDPTEKVWPFNSSAQTYCLDTWNPIAGDQNLPAFPTYANPITNIDISKVFPKNNTLAANSTGSAGNVTSASSTSVSATVTGSTTGTPSSATTSRASSAQSRVGMGSWTGAAIALSLGLGSLMS